MSDVVKRDPVSLDGYHTKGDPQYLSQELTYGNRDPGHKKDKDTEEVVSHHLN